MLTDNRKRRRSCDSEEDQQQLSPQAKRSGASPCLIVSDLDSESSSSDSCNGISSPESSTLVTPRPCIHSQNSHRIVHHNSPSPNPEVSASAVQHRLHGNDSSSTSYDYINRVLREAHFSSLQSRGRRGST
ncbi:protein FAM104A [Cynoglossus semilaevis]|uniref:protein FAM104A n=1 Tax=Cynoglossus semilaevis TaxID=244447 RepID=UPI00049852E8|nr:protein FAM104A [Cynoglossus semilaevis]